MLGKLASNVTLTQELKTLSNEGRVGGWGMTELPTGGGKTKRWILIWTATPLRLCDSLSRKDLPPSLKKSKPASGEKRGKVSKLGPGWTRKELYGVIKGVLDDLDGCFCYPIQFVKRNRALLPRRAGCRNTIKRCWTSSSHKKAGLVEHDVLSCMH